MNIIDYLPIGSESTPITRDELARITGCDDRKVRDEISRLKKDLPIINIGKGYYIADDPDDPNLKAYIISEMHRIREISRGLKKHKWLYKINKKQETLKI
jgi:hypothetical protein